VLGPEQPRDVLGVLLDGAPVNTNANARGDRTARKVEAYGLGKRAFQEDRALESNPFPADEPALAAKWAQGWRTAHADDRAAKHQHGHGSD
jgi:hypothetical protein